MTFALMCDRNTFATPDSAHGNFRAMPGDAQSTMQCQKEQSEFGYMKDMHFISNTISLALRFVL